MATETRLFEDEGDPKDACNFPIHVYREDGTELWRGMVAAWGTSPNGDLVLQRRILLDPDHPALVEAVVINHEKYAFIEPMGYNVDVELAVGQQDAQREAQEQAERDAANATAAQVLGLRPEVAAGPNRAQRRN